MSKKLTLENYKFSVAPMMGVTTPQARYLYRLLSKKVLLWSEMIAAQAIYKGDINKLLGKDDIENPVILQVGGSEVDLLKNSANLAEKFRYDGINLNVGCPSKKVSQGNMGACLMKESRLVKDCITAMIQETSIHVSVKCRIGVDEFESYEFFKNFISTVAESGCDTFIIHARKAFLTGLDPKKNRTIPPLNYEYVYKIKKDLPDLKFIINGGFINLKDCQNQLSKVDGVMVGRAIQSNPFLLTNVDEVFYNQEPSKIDRLMVVKEYFDYIQSSFDHTSGYKLLSPLLAMCFGLPGSKKFKQNVNELIRSKDILKLKETYIDLLAA